MPSAAAGQAAACLLTVGGSEHLRVGEIARTLMALGVTNDEPCCLADGAGQLSRSLDQDHECPDIVEVGLQLFSQCAP